MASKSDYYRIFWNTLGMVGLRYSFQIKVEKKHCEILIPCLILNAIDSPPFHMTVVILCN